MDLTVFFIIEELSEGMEAKVTCVADANPNDVTYRWYRNGKEVTGATGSVLNLGLLTRNDHDASLACEAANSAGEVRKYRRINLRCKCCRTGYMTELRFHITNNQVFVQKF